MFPSTDPDWRAALTHPLAVAALLLLPIVFLLGPLPIDETRYLAVAWEMRQTGEYLVPHLNGATYAHKPPLLFWLIDAGWLLTGVHAWTARAMTLLCSLASLVLMQRLTLRLTGSATTARASMWFLLGAIYFALFSNAIMFDVPLTTCVLVALHGVLDLVRGRMRRGVLLTGAAIGLGILVKGPVMLLDVAFVALAAPWWSGDALAGRRARYFAAFGLSILVGALIALAWAIPAALHGGEAYARAIFLNQTLDRIGGVKGTSAHGRPLWWYIVVFPLMLLPWPLVLRPGGTSMRTLATQVPWRFAVAWVVPTFVAFSLVGGKQPHYLLPMIPGVALLLAVALERDALRVRVGAFGLFLVLSGVATAALHWLAPRLPSVAFAADVSPLWGCIIAAVGLVLAVGRKRFARAASAATAMLAVALVIKLAVIQGAGDRYDIDAIAARIHDAQERGQPVAHLGWHHGVYEFAGRLVQPLPALETLEQFQVWAREHPDGYVVSFYRRFRFRADPVHAQKFRGGELAMWKAADALASGVDPAASHAGDEPDDSDD
ncbi:glycosyltransferase family 39 protein [Dokdonella sp.]|uniref:ArnT family glycosyltransferase n=1 Tax=Dokdonella sp. TaxID=2291710 RepID=UPI002F3F529B